MLTLLTTLVAQITPDPLEPSTTPLPVVESTLTDLSQQASIWTHILASDPILKITLLILIGFSVASWAIIFFKTRQLTSAQKTSVNFWQRFSAAPSINDLATSKGGRSGPLYELFVVGQQTLSKIKKATSSLTDLHRNILLQKMHQSREEEVYKLEQYVGFLATTASATPFIGLFGTVYGILMAFMKIGKEGSTSLATVGPHISEALVATAVGLFAAIPAVIAYNYFVGKVKVISKMMDLFANDFLLKSEREIAT